MNRLYFTTYKEHMIQCMENEDDFYEFEFLDLNEEILGNIYVARVEKKLKNIDAYFVSYAKNRTAFLSQEDCSHAMVLNPEHHNQIQEGSLLLVQITKKAIKTKDPSVSTLLTLKGKYVILDLEKNAIRYSSKLNKKKRIMMNRLLQVPDDYPYGILIRSQADNLDEGTFSKLTRELTLLTLQMDSILSEAKALTMHSLVYQSLSPYIKKVQDIDLSRFDRITTDNSHVFHELELYFKAQDPEHLNLLAFYKDSSYSLNKLHRIDKKIEDALRKTVYLKNGAELYFEETEAMHVIDVNSGKAVKGKVKEDSFFHINMIACEEIARQIRLRNLSGIIIVDFINMTQEVHEKKLISFLKELLENDPIHTQFIDITKLGLIEITRKRIHPSLKEQYRVLSEKLDKNSN